jgi:hypothetical protein
MIYLHGDGLVTVGHNPVASFVIETAKSVQITVGDYPNPPSMPGMLGFHIDASNLRIADSKSKTANKFVHTNNDPLPHMSATSYYTLRIHGFVHFSLDQTTSNQPPAQLLPTNPTEAIIDIVIPSLSFKRLNAKWNLSWLGPWANGITILFVSMILMVIVAFALLNSLGALSGSLTGLAGIGGVVILAVPFLSISSLSKLVADRWKLLSKTASLILAAIIFVISSAFLVVPTLGYLGPSFCLPSPYPSFPAFSAGSQLQWYRLSRQLVSKNKIKLSSSRQRTHYFRYTCAGV